MRRALRIGTGIVLWVGLPVTIAQVVASPVMLFGLFGFDIFSKPPSPLLCYAWTYYRWNYPKNPNVREWALYGAYTGGAAALLVLTTMIVVTMRRSRRIKRTSRDDEDVPDPERAASNVFGRARWMEEREAKRIFTKPDPDLGFIPIVEINRVDRDRIAKMVFDPRNQATWGRGGRSPLLCDPMVRGAPSMGIIIGGSGAGKTSGFTIPALCRYRGSMVINDPSGQASKVTARFREEIGHDVSIIDPEHPEKGAFNVLKTIDLNSRMAEVWVKSFVVDASGPAPSNATKEQGFFKEKGIALNTCLLLDLLYDPALPANRKTVREWRERIVTPEKEMKKRLQSIYAHTKSRTARHIAGELMDTFVETMSGIRSHATGDTEWLSLEAYADLLSEDTFDPTDLCRGKRTVFIQFPSRALNANASVARIAIGGLLLSVMSADGRVHSKVPFTIDEMDQLKYMQILAEARDQGRKYGVVPYPMWQSEGQIEDSWGGKSGKSGKKSWFSSAAWRLYIGVDDPDTASEISRMCGSYTAVTHNEGTSSSSPVSLFASGTSNVTRTRNYSSSLSRRLLLSEDEVRTNLRGDEGILFMRNQPPARFGIPFYYRRQEMLAVVDDDTFQTDVAKEEAVA